MNRFVTAVNTAAYDAYKEKYGETEDENGFPCINISDRDDFEYLIYEDRRYTVGAEVDEITEKKIKEAVTPVYDKICMEADLYSKILFKGGDKCIK